MGGRSGGGDAWSCTLAGPHFRARKFFFKEALCVKRLRVCSIDPSPKPPLDPRSDTKPVELGSSLASKVHCASSSLQVCRFEGNFHHIISTNKNLLKGDGRGGDSGGWPWWDMAVLWTTQAPFGRSNGGRKAGGRKLAGGMRREEMLLR